LVDRPQRPKPLRKILDRVPNPYRKGYYAVRFSAPEFTVLCAVAGQPDFAQIMIDYVPREWLIESKSLKFFLASFRNHSGFHEETTITIGTRLADILKPIYLRVGNYWYPRGGMPIDVFWANGSLPDDIWPPLKMSHRFEAEGERPWLSCLFKQ
jgi:7-cyano-7-deazaguanine reductase